VALVLALPAALIVALCVALVPPLAAAAPAPAPTAPAPVAAAPATAAPAPTAKRRPIPVSVSFDRASPGAPIPHDFLGLSFEATSLSQIAGYADSGDMVALLRSLGVGVLRFGGVSADTRMAWTDATGVRPAWASGVLEARDLRQLGVLAARSGWRVLLTVGLGHYEPEAAAREAAAARAALGAALEGIELGNEPDAYALHGLRAEPWTFVQYSEQAMVYRGAIEAAAPGIPLAGPDVSGSSVFESWGPAEVIDQRPALLTGHHYPLGCRQQPAPTIARLLSPRVAELEGASLRRYTSVAQAGGIPFRLDEANNVSCGGVAGISDTFAAALWAVGYLIKVMSSGVAGINLHGNPANCDGYTPLCAPSAEDVAAGVLRAQPEWYALLLAKALLGDRPLATVTRSAGRPNVRVATFLADDGRLHCVIVDDDPPGSRSVAVRLRVGEGFRGASILSLTAPSPAALAGVRLGERAVAGDGTWSAPARLPRARNRGGAIVVAVAPSSAALLTVRPRA
jgi:hypothetical protein